MHQRDEITDVSLEKSAALVTPRVGPYNVAVVFINNSQRHMFQKNRRHRMQIRVSGGEEYKTRDSDSEAEASRKEGKCKSFDIWVQNF